MKTRPGRTFIGFALLIFGLLSRGCASSDRTDAAQLLERWRVTFNSHDLAGFTNLYADSGVYFPPGLVYFARTRSELRENLDRVWRATADMRIVEIKNVIAADGEIAFVWRMETKTHLTSTPIISWGASLLATDGGLIIEQTTVTSR